MSQKRLFEFESNDSTIDLNTRYLVSESVGVQGGFDFVPTPDMNLNFNHIQTGLEIVNIDLSTSKKGVIVTKQGVAIFEDVIAPLPIASVGNVSRRDAIIVTHSYQYTTNGTIGLYSVITNVGPNEPTLLANQNLIGILELPANCTALNQAGVNYIRKDADLPIRKSEKGKNNGVATLNSNGKIPFLQLPEEFNKTTVVPTIADRNALEKWEGRKVHVSNATGDPTVTQGSAGYIWTGSVWEKIYESESLDISLANYYTKQQVDDLVQAVSTPVGAIIQTDEILGLFDNTGLGLTTGKWKGWALCNGSNNTPDMRGRVSIQFDERIGANLPTFSDDEYNTLLAVGGFKDVVLTENQLPQHNHSNIKTFLSGLQFQFDRILHFSQNGTYPESNGILTPNFVPGTPVVADSLMNFQEPIITDSMSLKAIGNNESHENRQPFIVMAHIKKII